jgi:hypothetical protein
LDKRIENEFTMKKLLLFSLFATLSYAATAQTSRIQRDSLKKEPSGRDVAVIEIEVVFTAADTVVSNQFMKMEISSKKGSTIGMASKNGKATLRYCGHCFPAVLTISSNDFKPVKIKLKEPGSYRVHTLIKYDKNYFPGETI